MNAICSECRKPTEAIIQMLAADGDSYENVVEGSFCKLCIVNGEAGVSLIEWAKRWL